MSVPRPEVAGDRLLKRSLVEGRGWEKIQPGAPANLRNRPDARAEIIVLSHVAGRPARDSDGLVWNEQRDHLELAWRRFPDHDLVVVRGLPSPIEVFELTGASLVRSRFQAVVTLLADIEESP